MELLNKEKQWFFSDEAKKQFSCLDCVEKRAVFIYSYLKTFADYRLENHNLLFKTAFLLADAIYNSELDYHTYPEILDEKANPFVAFIANAQVTYSNENAYLIFTSIVHGIANPYDKNEWIYDYKSFRDNKEISILDDAGHIFISRNKALFADIKVYDCDKLYHQTQLELVWLFLRNEG